MIPYIDKQWTLFLDRDGVINERPVNDYVRNPDGFIFLPGVTEAIRLLSIVFERIILVTNQQGVGLGLMSKNDLDKVHEKMLLDLKESGGRIDAIYCCTDVKTTTDNCRKPGSFMAESARKQFPEIQFSHSLMVGDTSSDILFGKQAGMKTVQIGNEVLTTAPDMQFKSLYQFARYCINQ